MGVTLNRYGGLQPYWPILAPPANSVFIGNPPNGVLRYEKNAHAGASKVAA
jgi:hypothetical protein